MNKNMAGHSGIGIILKGNADFTSQYAHHQNTVYKNCTWTVLRPLACLGQGQSGEKFT